MRRQTVEELSTAIRAHTERRTLEELAAGGRRSFRVVSGSKVLRLIEAIVDDSIRKDTMEQVVRDRDSLIAGTRQEFERVLKIQAEQDALIRKHKDMAEHYREELASAEERVSRLTEQLETERSSQSAREGRLISEYQERVSRLEAALRETDSRATDGDEEREKARRVAEEALERSLRAEGSLRKAETRLANASATIEAYEAEREKLERQLEEALRQAEQVETELRSEFERQLERKDEELHHLTDRFESERGALAGLQEQALGENRRRLDAAEAECEEARRLEREARERAARAQAALEISEKRETVAASRIADLETEVGQLREAVTYAREQEAEARELVASRESEITFLRETAEQAQFAEIHGEISELKGMVRSLAEEHSGNGSRGPDAASLEAIRAMLDEREGSRSEELEERFSLQMERTLDEVTRALKTAVAKPVHMDVEATDVLVERVFDHESEMSTNLGALSVEESRSQRSISSNLALLRKARGQESETD